MISDKFHEAIIHPIWGNFPDFKATFPSLSLFQIPQISYASTSVELSDKTRFGFFSRVVPPDNFQAQVMVDIVKRFNWTYVSTIAEEGEYGEKGIEYFKRLASREGICIAEAVKIVRNSKPEDFIQIIKQLYSKPNARGVVMFVDEDNCRKLLNASRILKKEGHFAWLGSDSWGRKLYPVRGQEETAVGAITILPKRNSLQGECNISGYLSSPRKIPSPNMIWPHHQARAGDDRILGALTRRHMSQ